MLDFISELILELMLEGSYEISKNRKISRWIRYPLIVILLLFFSLIIFGLIYLGLIFMKDSILIGVLLVGLGIVFLGGSIVKFRKVYINKVDE